MTWLGMLATMLFTLATGFQARKSWLDGHSRGVSHAMIWMLLSGFSMMNVYVLSEIGWDWVLLASYNSQLALWCIIAKYKYAERSKCVL